MLFRWGENGKSARLECRRKMAWRAISPAAPRSSRPSPAAAWRHRYDVPVGRWHGAQYGGAVGLHPVSRNEHGGERLGRQIGDANLKMTASGDGIVTLKSDVQCSCKIGMLIAKAFCLMATSVYRAPRPQRSGPGPDTAAPDYSGWWLCRQRRGLWQARAAPNLIRSA